MDVLLDEVEREIRAAARDFLDSECPTTLVRAMEQEPPGYSAALWKSMAELGWVGASLPVEVGGQGLPLSMTGLLLQEAGRHLAPVPLHSCVVAGLAVARHGSLEQQQRWLPDLCAGRSVATLALQDGTGVIDDLAGRAVSARRDGDELVLDGIRGFVDNASVADWVLVPVREQDGRVGLVVLDAVTPGLSSIALVTTAKDEQSKLVLDGVRVSTDRVLAGGSEGASALVDVFDHAVALLCAQIAGATRKDVEMAAAYAKDRHAFGRPIGSFQALQHLCADMIIRADGAELLAAEAIWRLGEGLPASVEVSQAKSFTDQCIQACRSSQQIHGGIGFMMEFDLQLWYRRVVAWSLRLGSKHEHRARIAFALLDGNGSANSGAGAPPDDSAPRRLRLGDTLMIP